MTAIPHRNHTRQNTKHEFQNDRDRKVDHRITALPFIGIPGRDNASDKARHKDDECIDDTLKQRHGHHIAIRDMTHLMSQYRFRFIPGHVV
ncbi:hypothetical protein BQ6471_03137 [Vibrio gazogenes]|nr:hypothetical protein BQ6471_03137 [Vibrio gazogenes]